MIEKNTQENNVILPNSVSIITLGCKVNQYESDSIALALEEHGYMVKRGLEMANIYVINTCAVTNEGERKSRGMVAKILKQNPCASIFVCGCASHYAPQKFANKNGVKFVLGTANKMQVVDAILSGKTGVHVSLPTLQYDDSMKSKQTRTRAFIKIQDGCNSFCSYCIIPYLRGRSRSRSIQSIQKELNTVKSQEVVFVGVDVSQYGQDLPDKPTLVDVVELMRGRSARFRFSSLEMGSITKELLEHLSTMPNFCPHFHLSMQSGSNTVLKRMNRKHTKEDFKNTVALIRQFYPFAAITTDVICGFPQETQEEAAETLQTCKEVGFYEMHVFPFSPREGTVAAKMTPLHGSVVKARAKELEALAIQMKKEYLDKQVGTMVEVLVEKILEPTQVEGYSKCYVRTVVSGAKNVKVGDIILAKVERADFQKAYAKMQ